MVNRLISETSPYLLQHAHNPVDWYPWGEEALNKAKMEDKPILISIGYAACHWCHVMEKESFEDEHIAAIMNKLFVNVKIDREERPDLDNIYMEALQTLTGQGGWPLNVFLTPDARPFYGGTYFPPERRHQYPSWTEVLTGVNRVFQKERSAVEEQAKRLTENILSANKMGLGGNTELKEEDTLLIADALLDKADRVDGGFGLAPKFPQTMVIRYLLRQSYFVKRNRFSSLQENDQYAAAALLTLNKMIEGGIYDQLGGGFARYATDTEWLIPHFEKMLYDNALLVSTISEAYQYTRNPLYKTVVAETIAFIKRELRNPMGGFYAALDADSEGVEGKYYVWTASEVKEILGADASFIMDYYDIREDGNWEDVTILRVVESHAALAEKYELSLAQVAGKIASAKEKMLKEREKRVRPGLDNKVLVSWNALMNTALSKAYQATGEPEYLLLAKENMEFIWNNCRMEETLFHNYTSPKSKKIPAFLDDYAFLIQAMIELAACSGENHWLEKAIALTEKCIFLFSDEETSYFYFTSIHQQDILLRKKEVYDGATPSGNAVMLENLFRLSAITGNGTWEKRAEEGVRKMQSVMMRYPVSFGYWALLLQWMIAGRKELICGNLESNDLQRLMSFFMPDYQLLVLKEPNEGLTIFTNRYNSKTALYLCSNHTCSLPVDTVNELLKTEKLPVFL